jgi:hypothetical protein
VEIFNLGRWQCPVALAVRSDPADLIGAGCPEIDFKFNST